MTREFGAGEALAEGTRGVSRADKSRKGLERRRHEQMGHLGTSE